MDTARVKEWLSLRRQAEAAGAEADELKKQAALLERQLLEDFSQEAIQNIQVDGRTVYLKRTIYVGREEGVETPQILEALRAAGLGHFVTENFNSNTVAAFLRELDKNDEPLPEPLDGVIKPVERFTIESRKAGKSR